MASPRLVFGDNKKSAWTKPIHKKADSDEDGSNGGDDSGDEATPVAPTDKAGVKRKQSAGRKKNDTNTHSIDNKDSISQLHAAIAKANKERLALETATRDNLKDMEKLV